MAEFYQKVKQEIEKGISAVSIKSKEVLENMKINKQVEALQGQIAGAKTKGWGNWSTPCLLKIT